MLFSASITDSLQSSKSNNRINKVQYPKMRDERESKRATAHGIYSLTYIIKQHTHYMHVSNLATLKNKKISLMYNNNNNNKMRLLLSSDAKPRLRWTSELHHQFVAAVDRLGGAHKATPKSLMRIMAVDGLTLYHLKSHLQKYRMGRSHQNKQQNSDEKTSRHSTNKTTRDSSTTENLQMTRALQMQMEVQRKLHEQIEVQKDLQLRVEAQGKYLQRVVRKAQETISEYGSCSIEAEHARAQLAELASMVDSVESSLTSSSEASTQRCQLRERSFLSLSLHPEESIDLNCTKSGPKFIDLNS